MTNEPLGLPRGSIRAILVLLAALTVIIPVFVYVFRGGEIPGTVKELVIFTAGGLMGLIKDYINYRVKANERDDNGNGNGKQ